MTSISRRAFQCAVPAYSWEEIFEAGPYYQRVSEILEDAQRYAIFVGWQIDSRLPLPKPSRNSDAQLPKETLKEKILRLVESKPGFQFYFLMWDHAYFYVLERETWQGRIWDDLHPRVHFLFDNRHPFGGSHHEKLCIIDGTTAFCGGIDLCDERWDSPQHLYSDPRRSLRWAGEHHGPYHDIAVQVKGPVCAELQEHVHHRWRRLSTVPFPPPPSFATNPRVLENTHRIYLSRTLAEIEAGPRRSIVREIEFLFRDLIHAARHRIILEGQYYWSEEINDMLIAKIREMRGQDFEIFLILADTHRLKGLTRQLTLHELKLLEQLEAAAKLASVRLTAGFPHVHPPANRTDPNQEPGHSKPIYIHSKVMVIDDSFIAIGSANLASRAIRVDTEVTLTFEARTEAERSHVRRFGQAILKHWNLAPQGMAASDVHLHLVNSRHALRIREAELSSFGRLIQDRFPWKYFFDPKTPWFHPLERNFRRSAKSRFPWIAASTFLLWILSSVAAVAIASGLAASWGSSWEWIYALVLTSVWFAPIPFTGVAILGVFQLGFDRGAAISIAALWVSALQGYWLTRVFPTYLTRFYRASGPSWLPKRLGLRQFPATVSVSLDPRIMLRSKIAYQGLYCVPIPWFAMNLLLILPSALYVFERLIAIKMPSNAAKWISGAAPWILTALMVYSIVRLIGSSFRKRRKRDT